MNWYNMSYVSWPQFRSKPFADLAGSCLYDNARQPIVEGGRGVGLYEIGVGQCDVRICSDIYMVPPSLSSIRKLGIGDCMAYRIRGHYPISRKAYQCLSGSEIKSDSDTILVWLHVVDSKWEDVVEPYCIMWTIPKINILDRKQSVVRLYPGTDVIAEVKRYVFCREQFQWDLLRAKDACGHWFANQKVKDALGAGECEGFRFELVGAESDGVSTNEGQDKLGSEES